MRRREFVQVSGMATAGLLIGGRGVAYAYSVSPPLQKFIQPLRRFGLDIPLATKDTVTYTGVDYYDIVAGVFRDQLHPALLNATRLYGYADANKYANGQITSKHLGGGVIATRGTPVRIKNDSRLPSSHILPFDATIPSPGNGGNRQDRMAIHLHGALVPWASDGGPFHWKANPLNLGGAQSGASVIDWLPDAGGVNTFDNYYPNDQSARLMWYHDHAVGITRLNAYAGIATAYILTDGGPTETALNAVPTEYLVFQDKVFWDPAIDPGYSTWVPGALPGDLWYPYLYEKQIWKQAPSKKTLPPPIPSAVAEFFGDTMLVNGTVYPWLNMDAGMTRFRMLNACNARFLNLTFVYEDPLLPGEPMLGMNGLPMAAPVVVKMFGTEGGWLPRPVDLFVAPPGGVLPTPLLLGPAERADIVVDFSLCTGNVLLYNDAPAPYPGGSPMFDYFLGVKGVTAGFGPNTRTILQFRRTGNAGALVPLPVQGDQQVVPTVPDRVNGGLKLATAAGGSVTINGTPFTVAAGSTEVTLNEAFDGYGRLQQLVGTNIAQAGGGFGQPYLNAPTEFIGYNKIYIWNVYNLTADAHPMHFHEFNAMVLRRRTFKVNQFNGIPIWTALGRGPDPTETGFKETVKMFPGECTTVAVVVEDPLPGRSVLVNGSYTGNLPDSPRLTAAPYSLPAGKADEYVWHCHILEHEEHDMMRPLVAGNY